MKKRGMWRIIEATIAILLVAGTLFFLIAKQERPGREGFDILQVIRPALDEIAKNNTLRELVLEDTSSNSDAENTLLFILSQRISNPSLAFNVTVCDAIVSPTCGSSGDYPSSAGEVYTEERMITATLNEFAPKIVKVYVWQS